MAILFVITGIATAQTATFAKLPVDQTMQTINTNYTLTNAVVSWFLFTAKKNEPTTQDYQVNLDSLSGNHTNIAIKLYGKKFTGDSWTQIGETVNSTGSITHTATETISNAGSNRYRYYKAEFTGTGTGTTTIDWQKFKQWIE